MKSELLLNNFSSPQNHALLIAKQVFESLERELHINDLVKRVARKRKTTANIVDEARIIQAVGFLIAVKRVKYYKGFAFRNDS